VAIGIAWAVSLGWLVKREFFRTTGERLAEAALAVPPGTVFYRVDLAGQQVGFASTTVDTLGPALRVTDVLQLELPVLGHLHRTRARSRAVVSRALRLETLDVAFDGAEGRFTAHGEVSGDSVLTVALASAGGSHLTRLRLAHPIVVPALLPLRLAFGGGSALKPGRTFSIRVFDPVELSERDVGVTIAAESTLVVPDSAGFDSTAMAWTAAHFDTVRAFRIEQRSEGLTTSAWIDAQGHVVRATGPVGLTLERTAYEIAYQNFRHRDTTRLIRASAHPGAGDVIASTAIAAGARLAAAARDEFRVVLAGVDLSGLDLSGGRQERVGDTLIVRRETAAALTPAYRLPARDPTLAPWLAPQPLIQSAEPRIRAEAERILGGERDPARAAERLTHGVAALVRKEVTVGMPSAVRVLAERRGDCNELTVLYVALARAVGLPARSAAGIVELGGRFYYHAWPEVYLGSWVAVDPTLDQFPADAAHLRFVVGGLARQVQLIRFIGRLKLEGL
jgi:transglutaminase-like putative cysteine protease